MAETDFDRALFNINPMVIDDQHAFMMGEVTSLAIFESNSQVFDEHGLFSTTIFGPVGSTLRLEKPGYIDLKIPILHPLVYKHLISLNANFDKILSGKMKARFDPDTATFIEDSSGGTGYEFFMQYIQYVDFKENASRERRDKITLVRAYSIPEYRIQRYFVIPAGLRDYGIDAKGRPTQDEINDLYRKMIATVNMIRNSTVKPDEYAQYDIVRYKLQNIAYDIFMYIKNLIEGKKGFIQGKWASRAIMDGTRNVITANTSTVKDLRDTRYVGYNHTSVGIYQYVKAIQSLAMHHVHKRFILGAMNPYTNNVKVIDSKTMKTTVKTVAPKVKDAWLTRAGLTSIFNKFEQDVTKSDYAKIGDDYIALIDDQKDKIFVIKDTNNVPNGANLANARPITYTELVYISIYDTVADARCLVTRYPVTGTGSIYPSRVYLKTTMVGREVDCYVDDEVLHLTEYPIDGQRFLNSVSPGFAHLGRLGADFDGDSMLGCIHVRFRHGVVPKRLKSFIFSEKNSIQKDKEMATKDKYVMYTNGLVNLKDFPKGKLLKTEGNTDYYKVPNGVEVLTVWNGKTKWVHPVSYSVHRGLRMLNVKIYKGGTLQCSDDHSIVTVDNNLKYTRANPEPGMVVPKLRNAYERFIQPENTLKTVENANGDVFKVDNDLGYLFGTIIGDGWVNYPPKEEWTRYNPNSIMLATVYPGIKNKIDRILVSYGYSGNCYTHTETHNFDNGEYDHSKHTWEFKPVAALLREHIGHGALNKQLPAFWSQTSSEFRWGLLCGLMDTDGTVSISKLNKVMLGYSTTSQKLAYEVSALIYSLGMLSEVTVSTRKTGTVEYLVRFLLGGIKDKFTNFTLYNPIKAEKLAKISEMCQDKQEAEFTPMIAPDKLQELRTFLNGKRDGQNSTRVSDIIKRMHPVYGGSFQKHIIKEIMRKYETFFRHSYYWEKYTAMVEDDTIEWQLIQQVTPLPEITEAYDLTTPPYCTFVMENGIVVYDTVSFTVTYTKESYDEIEKVLKSKSYYVDTNGNLTYSASNNPLDLVIAHMTD